MADSNLDFGQGWNSLETYLKAHPDVRLAATMPEEGKFVIGVNDYLGLREKNDYRWIQKMKPTENVNHCFLLFDVKEADLYKK